MYNWAIFLIRFVNARIFYVINQIRVEDLYTTWKLLGHDNFVWSNQFENIFFK